jgi:chaperonin GroEL
MKNNNVLIKDFKNFDYGFSKCCEAVFQTYGSEGKLIAIQNGVDKGVTYTKDGVSVAKSIRFNNLTASCGALAAITGASRTLSLTQDSTTLTCILMHAFVNKMDRSKFTKKVEAGIYHAVQEVYEHLNNLSKKSNKEDLKKILQVAVNGDKQLADTIYKAFEYAKEDGIVEVVINPKKEKTEFIKQDGILLKGRGFASPYFTNKEDKRIVFEGVDVAILASLTWDYSPFIISKIQEFYQGKDRSTPLAIFIEKSNSEMCEKLIGIKQVGYNIVLIPINGYDEFEAETILNDVCMFTGASPYNPRIESSEIKFGLADKLVVSVDSTSIVVENVPQIFKDTLTVLEKAEKRDESRIARMKTRASIIEVSGLTPVDAIEKFDRIEDAVGSFKSTLEEGHIAGGGSSLNYISALMTTDLNHREKQVGYDLVKWVLTQPMIRLLRNGNREQPKWYSFWKKDYLKIGRHKYGVGYNTTTDEISDLIKDGIIDSKKSIRVAIESAVEQSIKVLNLAAIIHDPTEMTLD